MKPDIFDRPLVLFCSPRGGSSLVAGVFVRHGFWVGRTFGGPDGRGTGGYVNHENAQIKQFMKEHWPLDAGNHFSNALRADLRGFCQKAVPALTPWMFKGPSEYYGVWRQHFPFMRAVFVYRDEKQAVEAHVRRRGEKVRQAASEIVRARYSFMDTMLGADELSWRVDAEKVVDGDLGQIAPVLAEYGIALDHREAMKGISPQMFHR
jgi:hypothetical protein